MVILEYNKYDYKATVKRKIDAYIDRKGYSDLLDKDKSDNFIENAISSSVSVLPSYEVRRKKDLEKYARQYLKTLRTRLRKNESYSSLKERKTSSRLRESLNDEEALDFLSNEWGSDLANQIYEECKKYNFDGTLSEFLDHCVAQGGNWGGMFLSGIEKLYPSVYDLIPEQMGSKAFFCIAYVLNLLGVDTSNTKTVTEVYHRDRRLIKEELINSISEFVDWINSVDNGHVRLLRDGVFLPTNRGKVEIGVFEDLDTGDEVFAIPGFDYTLELGEGEAVKVFKLFKDLPQELTEDLDKLLRAINGDISKGKWAWTAYSVENTINKFEEQFHPNTFKRNELNNYSRDDLIDTIDNILEAGGYDWGNFEVIVREVTGKELKSLDDSDEDEGFYSNFTTDELVNLIIKLNL